MNDWAHHPFMAAALERSLAAFGPARTLGGWRDPFLPDHLIALVAYDAQHTAGILRAREQFETHFTVGDTTVAVTVYECAYFARLIARGIGRAVVCALCSPEWDTAGALVDLRQLAPAWWDTRARGHVAASGLNPPLWLDDLDVLRLDSVAQTARFDRLNQWVVSCR
jgi:hypothetical protein